MEINVVPTAVIVDNTNMCVYIWTGLNNKPVKGIEKIETEKNSRTVIDLIVSIIFVFLSVFFEKRER